MHRRPSASPSKARQEPPSAARGRGLPAPAYGIAVVDRQRADPAPVQAREKPPPYGVASVDGGEAPVQARMKPPPYGVASVDGGEAPVQAREKPPPYGVASVDGGEAPVQARMRPPPYGIPFVDRGEAPVQAASAEPSADASTDAARSQGGLPTSLRAGVERLSGLSMADVRVHYDSSRPAQLQALAYTQGSDIHVGPGQERHLAHEAWHVVQQKQGRVAPTTQRKGVALNDDVGLEREADVMGSRAAALGGPAPASARVNAPRAASVQRRAVIQRLTDQECEQEYQARVTTLTAPLELYRWGGREREERILRGWDLATVNNGGNGQNAGRGLYLADTPYRSMEYVAADPVCLKVVVHAGTPVIDTNFTGELGKWLIRRLKGYNPHRHLWLFDSRAMWYSLTDPTAATISKATLRRDEIGPLYEAASAGKKFRHFSVGIDALLAQSGFTLRPPGNLRELERDAGLLEATVGGAPVLGANQGVARRMRVYLWLAKIGKQPFTLRGTAITFTPNVNEVLLTLGRRTTNFDQSYTPQVLDAVRAWARQPFHMDKATFDATVLTPFQQAGDSYRRLRRRKTAGKASAMDGLGLRLAAWSKLLKFAEE